MKSTGVSRRLQRGGIVLALMLAFAAPWSTLCLAADAPRLRMACCLPHDNAPLVRPCCAMDADRSARTIPVAPHALAPSQPMRAQLFSPVARPSRCGGPAAPASRPIEIRLLTSVFLI